MNQIIIATIMRPTGETGVQTHFNALRLYLAEHKLPHELVTPFSYYKCLVYPVFAVRFVIDRLFGVWSVGWYRYWHGYFLRLALRRRLKSAGDCVIYAQCPVAAAAALRARVSVRQKVVMVVHFNISQADEWAGKGRIVQDGRYFRSIRAFEEAVLPELDGVVFVSEFMRRQLLARIPALADIDFGVVPNFLADPGSPEPPAAYSADLISIGSLEARKNQRYLLEILAAARRQGRPFTLTICGDGPDRKVLEDTARALQVDDLVNFAGFVNNAAERIALHKAFIHVASIENLPMALIESLARGRPLLATPVGGVPELLEGGGGLALPLLDAEAASELIGKALADPDWLAAAGSAARRKFLHEYASDAAAARLVNFFRSVSASAGKINADT